MKDLIYSEMNIAMMDEVPVINTETPQSLEVETVNNTQEPEFYEIDYSKYLGVLEIPKIGLKRGFYNIYFSVSRSSY